jgi:hypothetical protein
MKFLLVVAVLVLVGIAAFGFYRGWFQVSTADADHKSNVTFSVDQDKLRDDEQKLKDMSHKGSAPADKTVEPAARP